MCRHASLCVEPWFCYSRVCFLIANLPCTVKRNKFKSEEKKIETIFSAEVLRIWDSQNPADLQLPNGNIKLPLGIGYAESSSSSDSGGTEIQNYQYKGVKTKPKLIFNKKK